MPLTDFSLLAIMAVGLWSTRTLTAENAMEEHAKAAKKGKLSTEIRDETSPWAAKALNPQMFTPVVQPSYRLWYFGYLRRDQRLPRSNHPN